MYYNNDIITWQFFCNSSGTDALSEEKSNFSRVLFFLFLSFTLRYESSDLRFAREKEWNASLLFFWLTSSSCSSSRRLSNDIKSISAELNFSRLTITFRILLTAIGAAIAAAAAARSFSSLLCVQTQWRSGLNWNRDTEKLSPVVWGFLTRTCCRWTGGRRKKWGKTEGKKIASLDQFRRDEMTRAYTSTYNVTERANPAATAPCSDKTLFIVKIHLMSCARIFMYFIGHSGRSFSLYISCIRCGHRSYVLNYSHLIRFGHERYILYLYIYIYKRKRK